MNGEEFEHIFEMQVGQSRETLINKAKEYASDKDRLHNFKIAADFQQCTPEQALWGFATKHFVSLSDMVRSGEHKSLAVWDEKLGDAINYLFLLRALVEESNQEHYRLQPKITINNLGYDLGSTSTNSLTEQE